MGTLIVPNYIVNLSGSEQAMSTLSYELSYKRTISLFDEINLKTAELIVSELYALDDASHQDITIRISSPGGEVKAGFAIIDAMRHVEADIVCIGTGMVASMAAIILASATKGKRFVTPNTEVLIHQPLGQTSGQATDIRIQAEHMLKTRKKLNLVLSECTGQTQKKIELDTERDNIMTAEEAVKYGLADKILK